MAEFVPVGRGGGMEQGVDRNLDFLKYDVAQLSVLIVDNAWIRRNLVRSMLGALKIERIFEAETVTEALRRLHQSGPDLIIAELTMTPANGLDLVREIRTSRRVPNPAIPIIMLSVTPVVEDVCAARDAGIDEFVARPFALKVLYDRIVVTARSPRPIVVSGPYSGPDRRRQTRRGNRSGDRRRLGGWLFARH